MGIKNHRQTLEKARNLRVGIGNILSPNLNKGRIITTELDMVCWASLAANPTHAESDPKKQSNCRTRVFAG